MRQPLLIKRYIIRFLKERDLMPYKNKVFDFLFRNPNVKDRTKFCNPFGGFRWSGTVVGFEFWMAQQIEWLIYLTHIIIDDDIVRESEKYNLFQVKDLKERLSHEHVYLSSMTYLLSDDAKKVYQRFNERMNDLFW